MYLTNADVKILGKEVIYQGYIGIIRYKLQHKLFAGGWSKPFYRELAQRFNAVAVLPYDPKQDKVVLIEQFRIGTLGVEPHPWLLEIVAGIIDKDKTVEEIACAEVKEEAGLEVSKLIPICNYWSSPGGSTEQVQLYCGIIDASKAGGIHGIAAEHEDIKVHVQDSKEAFLAVKTGRINNAPSIIALQWLELHKEELAC